MQYYPLYSTQVQLKLKYIKLSGNKSVEIATNSFLRKRNASSLFCSVTDKHQRLVLVLLFHQSRILKTLKHSSLALNSGIRNVTNLVTVENFPMLTKILTVKRNNVSIVHKIDKGIASIASVFKIDWKIKEINLAWAMPILSKLSQEHLLRVLVGDISHH